MASPDLLEHLHATTNRSIECNLTSKLYIQTHYYIILTKLIQIHYSYTYNTYNLMLPYPTYHIVLVCDLSY